MKRRDFLAMLAMMSATRLHVHCPPTRLKAIRITSPVFVYSDKVEREWATATLRAISSMARRAAPLSDSLPTILN